MDVGKDTQSGLKQQFADLENDDKLNAELDRLKKDLEKSKTES